MIGGTSKGQYTQKIENLAEGIIDDRKSFDFDSMSDTELVQLADSWLVESKPMHDTYKDKQDKNERYYLGTQLDEKILKDINPYSALIQENRIFSSLETIVPNATSETPAPVVTIPLGDDEDDSKTADIRMMAHMFEEILVAIAQENKMSWKAKDFLRYNQLFYLGVWKFGVEEEENGEKKIWVENVRPQRIVIPPYQYPTYVMEYHVDTIQEVIEKFPKAKKQLEKKYKDPTMMGSNIGYWEITTDEYKFWKLEKMILKREKNPHYNFDNQKNNVWQCPKKDYIFSNLWTLGKNQYSQTTMIEQVISLQDNLNKRKRQIADNADQANGVLVAYETAGMTKEEQSSIAQARKSPHGVVFLEKAAPGSIQEFGGKQLQPFVMDDMFDTRNSIDNIMGTHAVLRGERTPGEKTLGEASLLKEGDRTRIGELVEMLEMAFEDLYNAFAQLIKKHFEKEQYISYLQKDGTDKFMKISSKMVREGIRIRVRQGSTLVKDKATQAQEAMVLWQQKAIDPVTMYEMLGFPNPYKMAERYITWTTAPQELLPDVYKKLESRIQSDRERDIRDSILQAAIEEEAMGAGELVPPFQGVTSAHLQKHTAFLESLMQNPNIDEQQFQNIKSHIDQESKILQNKISEAREGQAVTT